MRRSAHAGLRLSQSLGGRANGVALVFDGAGVVHDRQQLQQLARIGHAARTRVVGAAHDDCGRAVNPMILHGQTHGGIAQGVGQALWEHSHYDPQSGQLLAGNLADYLIPTATDFPKIRAIALENHRSPSNPLGVKGAGEGAIIPVGGLMANAVANALASFGAMPNELPLSPPRVWRLANPS